VWQLSMATLLIYIFIFNFEYVSQVIVVKVKLFTEVLI
jgi:hypothetical protein